MTAAVEALEAAIVRWSRAEAGTQQVTLAQYLAALDGWTVVTVGWRDGMVTLTNQYEAEITRLRAALEEAALDLELGQVAPAVARRARAALAPEAER